jgi:hypothetical protein
MKTLRYLIFLLLGGLSPLLASSQTISVDTSANWQQWISTILGGNCVLIDNVSFNSLPGSASQFTNAQSIGLSEGIVLSTGFLSQDISNTPAYFLGSVLGDNTDSLLETYALQTLGYTGNATSYDATRLEFDFTSPVNQTVSVRFVFASEEYPEFAPPNNSFFNDIFGFFVKSTDDTSYQNIATVPGTSLPVTIGNINAVTNESLYIETAAVDSFAFDGYTTPITATFQALAGVTYHMIIAISDIGDAIFDSAVFLEKAGNTNQSIQGTAYAGVQTLDSGYVNLYGFNLNEGAFPSLDSVDIAVGGAYEFQNVAEGLYLVQAYPDVVAYPLSVPTYYPGTALWQDAQAVSVACDDYAINSNTLVINTGPGGISGVIGADPLGGRLRANELIPSEGVHVLLQDSASLEWRGFQMSNVDGIYTFENLAFGTYYVYPDVPGIPIITPRKVVINAFSPSVDVINFQMNESGVVNISESQGESSLIELGSNIEWTVTTSNYYYIGSNIKIRLGIDTLINDTLYHSFYADGINNSFDNYNENEAQFIGGFRQVGTKLFVRFMRDANQPSPIFNKDLLYFDSSFDVNDSFQYPNIDGEMSTFTISNRDTINLNGVLRTRWKYSTQSIYIFEDAFVMGIGNRLGFFNLGSALVVDNGTPLNICYTDNSDSTYLYQSLYNNVDELEVITCFLNVGGFEKHNTSILEIFPNPGTSQFTVKQEKANKATVFVRDISGRIVYQNQVNTISETFNMAFLRSGIYLIELRNSQNEASFARWIKE